MAVVTSTFDGSEDPLSEGGKWTAWRAGWDSCAKVSGRVQGSSGAGDASARVTATIGDDQYAQLDFYPAGGNSVVGVGVRFDTAGTGYGYEVEVYNNGDLTLYRVDGGSWAELDNTLGGSVSSGTAILLQFSGSTWIVKRNGTQQDTGTDSTYSSGRPGIFFLNDGPSQGDDFEGGDLGSAAASFPPAAPHRNIQHLLVR